MFRCWLLCSFFVSLVSSELSQECLDELTVIQNDSIYVAELFRLEGERAAVPQQNFCTGDAASVTCIVDYEDFEDELEMICTENLGGVYLESDYTLKCVGPEGNERHDETRNNPACVGKSCREKNLVEFLDGQYDSMKQQQESEGNTCELEWTLEDSESGSILSPASRPVLSLCGLIHMAWYLIGW
jgi:hypothetical protein